MSFTPFHSIDTSVVGTNVELIAIGSNVNNIKSILITNTDTSALTISLFLQDTTGDKYHILYQVSVPASVSLHLDSDDMLAFNNSPSGYSLNISTSTTSDTLDVLIKK